MPVQSYRTVWPGPLSRYLRGGAAVAAPPTAPPSVSWVSPAPGTTIARGETVTLQVEDTDTALLIVSARYASVGADEVVYREGAFTARYTNSVRTVVGDVTTFAIQRVDGWLGSVTFSFDVVDLDGQIGVIGA